MARLSLALAFGLVAVLATIASAGKLDWFHEGTEHNKMIVTYSIIPDPFHKFSFFTMPRTAEDARKNHFIYSYKREQDNTEVYCYKGDYRVCLLFDQQESVAGIRLTIPYFETEEKKAPHMDIAATPEWELNWDSTSMETAYSATVFFQSKEELLAGGRKISAADMTAPNGLYILQTDSQGNETSRLHVSNLESEAESAGFTEQACFFGMGKHYFQELRKEGTCDAHRPYFMLYGPKTKQLNGFGFTMYGKPSTDGRPWFEAPPAVVAKKIAPNSPDCMVDYINTYGMFTLHVYFVSDPYYTQC